MTANNGWPGKPGVPLNPEEPRWHWVRRIENNRPFPLEWTNDWNGGRDFCWAIMGSGEPEDVAKNICYLGPVLTPDEAAALQARVALLVSIIRRSFCYDDEEDLLRLLARSLCRVEGQDPDAIISVDKGPFDKNWKRFLPQARAALEGGKDE